VGQVLELRAKLEAQQEVARLLAGAAPAAPAAPSAAPAAAMEEQLAASSERIAALEAALAHARQGLRLRRPSREPTGHSYPRPRPARKTIDTRAPRAPQLTLVK
jgi:hypothetical protein